MANIQALKTELSGLLSGSSNLTAQEKANFRDRFIALNSAAFQVWLAGQNDTNGRRSEFVAHVIVEGWRRVYREGHRVRLAQAAEEL